MVSHAMISVIMALFVSPQYDVSGTLTLDTDSSFYNQPVTSDVFHLSWQEGLNYITAVTRDSVS